MTIAYEHGQGELFADCNVGKSEASLYFKRFPYFFFLLKNPIENLFKDFVFDISIKSHLSLASHLF